jgi:light-harvesting protein B-800-850 alpha chain
MNNAKIWLVVKPTVGVPLFLTAVAVSSFAVHLAVLRNTTWLGDYLAGKPLAQTASIQAPAASGDAAALVYFDSSGQTANGQKATIVLADGRSADVVFGDPTKTASVAKPVGAEQKPLE